MAKHFEKESFFTPEGETPNVPFLEILAHLDLLSQMVDEPPLAAVVKGELFAIVEEANQLFTQFNTEETK